MDPSNSKDGITYLDEKKGVYKQKLEMKSEAYTCLMNKVKETCIDPVFEDRYWRTDKLELIKNEELEERYLQQRTAMSAKGLTDIEKREVYIFYGGSAKQCDEICREGHRTGLKKRPVLGHTGQGIHFVQHYDILTRYLAFLQFKATAHIMIYKAVLGKAKRVKFFDGKDNEPAEPDKKFDSFVALTHLEPRMSIIDALNSCYVYLYEFDETSAPVRFPRRVLPYALITLERKPCVTLDTPFLAVDSGSSELRWEVKGETRRGFRWNITKKPASRQSLKQKVDQVRRRRSQSKEENQKQLHNTGDCPPVLNRYDNELSSKPKNSGDEPPILDKHTKLDSIVREIGTKKERIQQIQEQRNTRERSSSPFRDIFTKSSSGEQVPNESITSNNSQSLLSNRNITTVQKASNDSDKCVNSDKCFSGCSEIDISAKTIDDSLQSEFWRNGEIDLLKTHSENSYTRTKKHIKTHVCHSVPRNLPSSLKPFINLTRIDSSGSYKGNRKPNSLKSHHLHRKENQNNWSVAVKDKSTHSAVRKTSEQQSSFSKSPTNGRIRLKITTNGGNKGMISSLIDDNGLLIKSKVINGLSIRGKSSSQLQSSANGKAKDDATALQCKVLNSDQSVVSSENIVSSQCLDGLDTCKTNSYLFSSVGKKEPGKGGKFSSQKTNKSNAGLHEGPEYDLGKIKVSSESQNSLAENEILNDVQSHGPVKISTVRTDARKDGEKHSFLNSKQSCNIICVDHEVRQKDFHDINSDVINNSTDCSTLGRKYDISSQKTEGTLLHALIDTIQPDLSLNGIEKNKSSSTVEILERNNYSKRNKHNSVRRNLVTDNSSKIYSESINKKNVTRNPGKKSEQNKNTKALGGYINDFFAGTEDMALTKANNKNTEGFSGSISKKRAHVSKSKSSSLQGRSKQALNDDRKSFDITVVTKRNNFVESESISYGDKISVQTFALLKDKNNLYDSLHDTAVLQTKLDKCEMSSSTNAPDSNSLGQREYMAGLALQRACSSEVIDTLEDGTMVCPKTLKKQDEPKTEISEANLSKLVNKSTNLNQGIQAKTVHEKNLDSLGAESYHSAKENIIKDNFTIKTKKSISGKREPLKNKCGLKHHSGVLSDTSLSDSICNSCKNPDLAPEQQFAVNNTAPQGKPLISSPHQEIKFDISPQVANEAPFLSNCLPNISSACGSDEDNLAETKSERISHSLSCSQNVLIKATNITNGTSSDKQTRSTSPHQTTSTKTSSSLFQCHDLNKSDQNQQAMLPSDEDKFPELRNILSSNIGVSIKQISNSRKNADKECIDHTKNQEKDKEKISYEVEKTDDYKRIPLEPEKGSTCVSLQGPTCQLSVQATNSRPSINAREASAVPVNEQVKGGTANKARDSFNSGIVKNGTTVDSETAKKLQKFLQESLDRAQKQKLISRESRKNQNQQKCPETPTAKSSDCKSLTSINRNYSKTISAKEKVLSYNSNSATSANKRILNTEQKVTAENACYQTCSTEQPPLVSHPPVGHGKPVLHRSDSQETVIGGIPDYYLTPPSFSLPAEEFRERHVSSLNTQESIDANVVQKNNTLDLSGSKSFAVETRHSTDSGISFRKDISQMESSLTRRTDNATDTLYENYLTQTFVSKDNMCPLDLTTKRVKSMDVVGTMSDKSEDLRKSPAKNKSCAKRVTQSGNISLNQTGKIVETNIDIKKEATPSTKETQSEITKTLHQLSQVLQEISKLSESKESKAAEHSLHKQSTCKTIPLGNEAHKHKQIPDCLTQNSLNAELKKDSGQRLVSANSKSHQISKEKCADHNGNQPEVISKQISRKKNSNDIANISLRETNQQSMQNEDVSVNCSLTSVLRQEDIRVMHDHYQHKTQNSCISDFSVTYKTCSPDTNLNSIKDTDDLKIQHNKRNPKLKSTITGNEIQTEPKNICMQKGGSNSVNKIQNLTAPSNIGIKGTVLRTSELQSNLTTLGNVEIKTESGSHANESDKCYAPPSNDKSVNSDGVHLNRNLITIKTEPIDFEFPQNERLNSEVTVPAIHPSRNILSVSSNTKGGAVTGHFAENMRSESRDENCMEYLYLHSSSHFQQEKLVQSGQLENQGLDIEASLAGATSFTSKSIWKWHDDPQSCRHEKQSYQNQLLDTLNYREELCQAKPTVLSQTSSSSDTVEQANILNLKRSYHPTDGKNTVSSEVEGHLNDVQCTKSQKGTVNVSLHNDKTGSSPTVYLECKVSLLSHEENDIDSAKLPYVFDVQDEPDITLLERFGNPAVKLHYRQTDDAPISSGENDEQVISSVNEGSHSEQTIAEPISCSEDSDKRKESISLGNEISHIDQMIAVPISSSEDGREGKQDLPLVKEEGPHIKQEIDIVVPSTTFAASDSKSAELQTRTKPKGVRNRSEKGLLNKGGKFISGIRKSKNINETFRCVKKEAPVSLCVPVKPAVQTSGLINDGVICSPADAEAVSLRIDEFLKTERMKSDSQSTDIKDSHTGTSSVSNIFNSIQKVHTDEPTIKTVERDCNLDRKRSRSTSCLSKERESKRMRNSKEKTESNEPIENAKNSSETAKRKGFELIPFSEIVRLKAEGLRLGCNRYGRYVYRSHRIGLNKTHRRKNILNGSKASIEYKTKYKLNVQGTGRDFKSKKPIQDKGVIDTDMTIKTQTPDKTQNEAGGKENDVLKEQMLKKPVVTESSDCNRKSSEPEQPMKVSSQDSYNGFDAFEYKTKPDDNTEFSKHKLRNRFNKGGIGYLNWRRRYPGHPKRTTSSNDRNRLQGNAASGTKRVLTESQRVAEREKAKKEIEEAVRHFRRTYEGTWEDFIADGKVASYLDTITDKLEVIQSKRNKINDETKMESRQKYKSTSQRNTYGNRLEQKRTNPNKTKYLTDNKSNRSTRSPNFSAPPESLLQEIVKEQFIKKVESVTTQVTKELTERFIEGIGYSADSADPLFETQSVPTDENESDFDLPCQQDGIISIRNDKRFHISKVKEISADPCNTNRERFTSSSQRFNGNKNFPDLGQHYFLQNEDNAQKMLAKNVADLERRYAPNRRFFRENRNCSVFGSKGKQNKFSISNSNRKMWGSKKTQSGKWGLFANDDIVNQRFCGKNVRNICRGRFNKNILYSNEQRSNIRKGSVSSNESDIEYDDTYEMYRRSDSKDSRKQSFGESFPRRKYSMEHRRSRSRSNSVTKSGDRRSSYGRDEMYNRSSLDDSSKNRRRSGSNISDRIDRMHDGDYENHDEMDRNSDCYSKHLFFIDHETSLFQDGNASRSYKHGDYSLKDDYHWNKSRRSHSNEKTRNKRRSNSNDGHDYHDRSRSTSSQKNNIAYQDRSKNDNHKFSTYKHSDNRHRVSILDRGNQCYDKYNEKGDQTFLKESKSKYDQDDTHSGIQKRSRSDHFKRSHKDYYREHYSRDRNHSDRGLHGRSDKKKSPANYQGHKFYENHSKGRDNRRGLNSGSSRNRSFHR